MELFKEMTGAKLTHAPYKGSAPAITDLIGNNIHMMIDNLPSAMPHILSGRLSPSLSFGTTTSNGIMDLERYGGVYGTTFV